MSANEAREEAAEIVGGTGPLAVNQLQALSGGNRTQTKVISQQNVALDLAGAAAWEGHVTNSLFTWQSASKQQEKQAPDHQKLANKIRKLEEAPSSPTVIDVDTTPISQVSDATCVSGTRLFVPPSVSASQAVPVGLCTLLDVEYVVRREPSYEIETAVASCDAIVQENAEKVAARIAEESIQKFAKERLDSSHMRYVITQLNGFSQSKAAFESGGVDKNNFFYKNDSISGQKTYISLAHDEKGNDAQKTRCGERSISIVLAEIEKLISDQGRNNTENSKILILLPQIEKAHWTLLEINTNPSSAQNHDSKGSVSLSRTVDFLSKKSAVERVVSEKFEVEMKYQYGGTQGVSDHHNCGRYALIQLKKLIGSTTSDESKNELEDINRILCGQKCSQIPETYTDDSASDDEDSFQVISAT